MLSLSAWRKRHEPPPLLGIDISSAAIKLVELGREPDGGGVLQHCAFQPLPPGCLAEGHIEAFDTLLDALRVLLRRVNSRTRYAAFALPNAAVIRKKLSVPAQLSGAELEEHIAREAEQGLPLPLHEVHWDFATTGVGSASEADEQEVLLVAARQDDVADRLALAEAVGLTARVLDIESHAARWAATQVIRQVHPDAIRACWAVFEMGSHNTRLQIVVHDVLLYEREQNVGGVLLTQQLAHHLGCDLQQAEQHKKSVQVSAGVGASVVQSFVALLAAEVGRALQFFFSSASHCKVTHIALTGGCAVLPGLAEKVAVQTDLPVHVLHPFGAMHPGPMLSVVPSLEEAAPYWIATGLAWRRFVS